MPKCDFNKVAEQIFPKNTFERLLLAISNILCNYFASKSIEARILKTEISIITLYI